jgi:hypothetical protein
VEIQGVERLILIGGFYCVGFILVNPTGGAAGVSIQVEEISPMPGSITGLPCFW